MVTIFDKNGKALYQEPPYTPEEEAEIWRSNANVVGYAMPRRRPRPETQAWKDEQERGE